MSDNEKEQKKKLVEGAQKHLGKTLYNSEAEKRCAEYMRQFEKELWPEIFGPPDAEEGDGEENPPAKR